MKKNYLKVISLSLLLGSLTFSNVGCHAGEVKVTFVTENNSDIVRYIKKGKTLVDIPEVPHVKGKYCLWEEKDYKNIKENMTVNALCYSTVTNLSTNMPSEIDVEVSSSEADLEYILKDAELEATFESGETKKLYKGDYTVVAEDYNKDVVGSYDVSLVYNNAKHDITVNVNKIDNYVTVSLSDGVGYFNEGLPQLLANTTIEGYVSFDKGQQLTIGIAPYSWTFTPTNTNKYAVVHGKINVNLINANSISANKNVINVPYGTSESEIIELIKEELVVKGLYGNTYRDIDPQYYTIVPVGFLPNISDTFEFKIVYDETVYTTINVEVGQCDNYSLDVNDVEQVILKDGVDLDDVLSSVEFDTPLNGTLSFKEGQTLLEGDYEYTYVFDPENANYASKEGKIKIHVYKAKELEFTATNKFKYGTKKEDIVQALSSSITGIAKYNNSLTKEINSSNVVIRLDGYNNLEAGEYEYIVDYNGELTAKGKFRLEKRYLESGVDYQIHCDAVDPSNYQSMPLCYITKLDTTEFDFDPTLFSIIPIADSSVTEENNKYTYHAELIPDVSISNNYERVEIILKLE